MQPELERDDQVVARVVAWHNRHPLATRITADQVHSVGVVSLPYAVRGAQVLADAPPAPAPEPAASPAADVGLDEGAEAAVELAIESPDEGLSVLPRDVAAAEGVAQTPAADGAATIPPALAAGSDPAPAPRRSTLPPRPRSWHPLAWWRSWRGQGDFQPLFSEDFIAPLRPRRVARWAARHGAGDLPLAADAPRRVVAADAQPPGPADAPAVELHLITAAIGVGDQRLRLLLAPGADGAVIGPRHWSRPRLATAAALALALVLPGAALPLLLRGGDAAPAVVAAASAAAPASAPLVVDAATSSPSSDSVSKDSGHSQPAAAPPTPVATEVAAASAPEVAWPVDAAPRQGRVDLPPLVKPLPEAERQAARQQARELRSHGAAPADDKAWALVTEPLDPRRAERAAAQLQAVALFQPHPMQVDRMPAGARFRAVFWPFTSAAEAEKVRLALADKGLKTEVLEF